LYNELILIEYSPITALNRAFAYARVYGNQKAIQEVEKLNLTTNNHYYSLLGYLYATIDVGKSINFYKQAIALTKSGIEKQTLTKEVERLTGL
jgi:RNA polymerase sigma-70 factor (ECF subfamily)